MMADCCQMLSSKETGRGATRRGSLGRRGGSGRWDGTLKSSILPPLDRLLASCYLRPGLASLSDPNGTSHPNRQTGERRERDGC